MFFFGELFLLFGRLPGPFMRDGPGFGLFDFYVMRLEEENERVELVDRLDFLNMCSDIITKYWLELNVCSARLNKCFAPLTNFNASILDSSYLCWSHQKFLYRFSPNFPRKTVSLHQLKPYNSRGV